MFRFGVDRGWSDATKVKPSFVALAYTLSGGRIVWIYFKQDILGNLVTTLRV